MPTHPQPSQKIAEAMMVRLMPHYPQPVELPREECPRCDGTGDRDDTEARLPNDMRAPCSRCHGVGTVRVYCCCCPKPATRVFFDDYGFKYVVCDTCEISDETIDRVLAWGLAHAAGIELEVRP